MEFALFHWEQKSLEWFLCWTLIPMFYIFICFSFHSLFLPPFSCSLSIFHSSILSSILSLLSFFCLSFSFIDYDIDNDDDDRGKVAEATMTIWEHRFDDKLTSDMIDICFWYSTFRESFLWFHFYSYWKTKVVMVYVRSFLDVLMIFFQWIAVIVPFTCNLYLSLGFIICGCWYGDHSLCSRLSDKWHFFELLFW